VILVTGASGFVGRHVVIRLAEDRRPLRAMVRDRGRARVPGGVEVVAADLTRPRTLAAAVRGATTVVHCAAMTADHREHRNGHYDEVNRIGTQHLVRAAREADVRRLVLISGLGTFEAPRGTYMATRWGMEDAIRGSGVPYMILQPSVLFGDGAPFVSALARLTRFPVVPLVGGEVRFQPLWIDDLTRCIRRAVDDRDLTGRSYPLGGSDQLTMRELMQAICRSQRVHRPLLPVPMPLARLQALFLAAALRRPPLTPATMELFGFDNVTDPASVQRTFGFRARGFREHVQQRGLEV
jgi:uncharacterized protein YbjT (DUF2867 family)